MLAIEYITSAETTIKLAVDGGMRSFSVLVWNPTVANLTLMALGSSAPEILLSVIETTTSGFYAGELGPSTIVGSAAFNLMVISAVCVAAIPNGETRKIKELPVFYITAIFSVAAYLWLIVILQLNTPNIVDIWEVRAPRPSLIPPPLSTSHRHRRHRRHHHHHLPRHTIATSHVSARERCLTFIDRHLRRGWSLSSSSRFL